MEKPVIVHRTKTVCWVNIVAIAAVAVFVWCVIDSAVVNGLISVLFLWLVYDYFKHRNECITLTEEGIGLDKVCIIDGGKKKEKCNHIDVEWRYIRRVEFYMGFNYCDMKVCAHNRIFLVDTSNYVFFTLQMKRWQKVIEEYGQVPCSRSVISII